MNEAQFSERKEEAMGGRKSQDEGAVFEGWAFQLDLMLVSNRGGEESRNILKAGREH